MTALPQKANAKLMDLKHEVTTHEAVIGSLLSRVSELRKSVTNNPTSPQAKDWEFEITKLQSQVGVRQAKSAAAQQHLAQIAEWHRTLRPGFALVDAKPKRVVLAQDETYVIAIGRVRQEIANLSSELRQVQRSHPTKKELLVACEKYTDDLIAKVTPNINATHEKFDVSLWPEGTFMPRVVLPALMAFLNRDAFLKKLQDAIKASPDPELVMSKETKAKRVKEIRDLLLQKEHAEEWLICEAAQDDVQISRRPMASPLATLGVALTREAKEAAAA